MISNRINNFQIYSNLKKLLIQNDVFDILLKNNSFRKKRLSKIKKQNL